MSAIDPLHEELNEVGEHFAIQLRAHDHGAAARALHDIAASAATMAPVTGEAAPRLSPVAPLPDGPLLRVDELSTRVDTRRRLADAVHEALGRDHVDGDVRVLEVDGLADLDRCRRAVVLRLFPTPAGAAGRLDPSWIDVAAEWVFGDQRPDADVRIRVLGVERRVPAADAAGVLHGCAAAGAWCDVVTGDVASRVRTASISFGAAPHVAIGGGGPRCDDDGMLARFDLLREVARELAAECAYACIDFEDTFADLGSGLSHADWALEGGAPPNTVAGRLCDRFVPEAFPLQVLGPGHLERLRADRPDRSWGQVVGGDRHELTIGEPVDWLPTSDVRLDVRADGWSLLAPVLLRAEELDNELEDIGESAPWPGHPAPAAASVGHGVPDLASLVIDPEQHTRRGTRLTLLELAAWFAGESHSDDPESVSPVLRSFGRHLGRGLDPARRQRLKEIAPRLVGTAAAGDEVERARAWMLTDWLVRSHAPPWLRRAGLTESADRLDGLSPVTADAELVRAVDLLGNAIVTASRRLEITTAIAGDNADVVDRVAWEIWEEAAEQTGWMAASEAVLHEIPADLAYAADQRVVECSRDPRMRSELEASAHGLGDAIWSAALHEIGGAAWRAAWDVTEDFVHHESTFSIRTTLRRSLETELVGGDDMAVELLLDEVDHAVRETLARIALEGQEETDFWKRAIDAASTGPRGATWRRALEETRRVLGATLFDDAVDVARAELHRWLHRAPRLVGRAVAAAVAREASGVAGRAIAARAAAERLARGGTEDDAEDAARAAVAEIVDHLADDALRMLDALVDARAELSDAAVQAPSSSAV